MAKTDIQTVILRGKLQYARVLGEPVLNYNKDGKEWKFDFIPLDQKEAAKRLKELGVRDRLRSLKNKDDEPRYDGVEYMSFKQKATKADGSDNTPINVVDASGNGWDQDKLIGNDTVVDLKFVVIDNGPSRFKGVYPRSIRVLKLEEYTRSEFDPLDEDDEFYSPESNSEGGKENTAKGEYDDLDDDLDI